ncbi:MAG: helical backbone metal receptor, partial [Pseudomonadota bacterium]
MSSLQAKPFETVHIDQMGREVALSTPPQRIVSLVPSQTELLIDLGLADRLVGITRYCVHPAAVVERLYKIGGTKRFSTDDILALKPD